MFEHFHVAVWSSMMPHNLEAIVRHVFGEQRQKLLFVWDQKKCSYINATDEWRRCHDAPYSLEKPGLLKVQRWFRVLLCCYHVTERLGKFKF